MKKYILFIVCSFISVNAFATDSFDWNAQVRTKWRQKGRSGQIKNEASIEMAYVYDNAWVNAKVKHAIADSSTVDGITHINLERCIVGYALGESEKNALFVEFGRDKMDNLFESKLQYKSSFNGLHLTFQNDEWKVHGGPHVVDSYDDQYGIVGEVIYSSPVMPIVLTYNLTHWMQKGSYSISQIHAKYEVDVLSNQQVLTFYGALLHNHQFSSHSNGGYFGLTLGKALVANDFVLDINCQYASKHAIPKFDFSGIGEGFHMQCKALYMVNDHLALEGKMNFGSQLESELSAIYKW